jgi:hypothetical protein
MSDLQTPDEGTEQTEPVTQPENTEEPVAPQTTEDVTPTPTGEPSEGVTPAPQPEVVPKDKFVASQRESILNNERVKVAESRIEQLTKQDSPTDEAMRQLYPEWDNLDEYNKRVLVRQETIAMQNARMISEQQELRDRQRLDDELDNVVDTNPKLKGKEAEFKRFARNPKNRGIAVDVLAKAFLYDGSDDESVPPAPVSKSAALPTGSGGPREPLKPKKISLEEAKIIRQTDNKRYMELAKAGMIDDDI